jgi:hypothetical protein
MPKTRLGLDQVVRAGPLDLMTALFTATPIPLEHLARNANQRWLVLIILQLGYIGLFCLAAWRATLVEAAVLGLGLIFVVTPAGSYYWVMLLALALLPGRVAPLMPIVLAVFVYGHEMVSGTGLMVLERFYGLSWGLALFFFCWFGVRAKQSIGGPLDECPRVTPER